VPTSVLILLPISTTLDAQEELAHGYPANTRRALPHISKRRAGLVTSSSVIFLVRTRSASSMSHFPAWVIRTAHSSRWTPWRLRHVYVCIRLTFVTSNVPKHIPLRTASLQERTLVLSDIQCAVVLIYGQVRSCELGERLRTLARGAATCQ